MKRRTVILAPEARADLLKLYDQIADATSPATAISFVERVEEWCLGFDLASERGYRRDDILPGLRVAGFEHRLTMAFVVTGEEVTILRFFYGGRDWEQVL